MEQSINWPPLFADGELSDKRKAILLKLIAKRDLIRAIWRIRQWTGADLRPAKNFVDHLLLLNPSLKNQENQDLEITGYKTATCKNCQQLIQDPIPTMHVCQVIPQMRLRRGSAAQLDIWGAIPKREVQLIKKGVRRVA
jgi:hypothetical protein